MLFLVRLCIFLWKYTEYNITDMVNKCAAPKCQRGYTSSTQENCWTKNEELNKKWIRFVNRSDWFLQNTQFYASCISKIFTKLKGNAWV